MSRGYDSPTIDRWPIFARFVDDWRGRTIEVYRDGTVTLDSGLFSHERKARGEQPAFTLLITRAISGGEITAWLQSLPSPVTDDRGPAPSSPASKGGRP
jgi:hypothetical protein